MSYTRSVWFKPHQNTETALFFLDSGDSTILVLSDSAAAFDTAHRMIPCHV